MSIKIPAIGARPTATGGAYTEADKRQDVQILHSMGYAQELERRMRAFSNFAVSLLAKTASVEM